MARRLPCLPNSSPTSSSAIARGGGNEAEIVGNLTAILGLPAGDVGSVMVAEERLLHYPHLPLGTYAA